LNSTDKGRITKKDAIEKLQIKLGKSKENAENHCRSLTVLLNHGILAGLYPFAQLGTDSGRLYTRIDGSLNLQIA
jgi:hypothetical protein